MALSNDPNITALDTQATQAENTAAQYVASSATLPEQLRQAVAERFSSSPLIKQRDTALTGYLNEPTDTRAYLANLVKGGTILSPTQQQQIAGARSTSATIPLVSLNDLLQTQMGSIGDIVTAGTAPFLAQAGLAQTQATQARSTANTTFDRLVKDKEYQLKLQELALKSGNNSNALLLAKLLGLTGGTGTPSDGGAEPMPTVTPSDNVLSQTTGTINSPAGEWTWDKNANAWKSNITSLGGTSADDQKKQAIALSLLGGAIKPAEANALTALLNLTKKPPTAQQSKDAINAQSGLRALTTVQELIAKDPQIILQAQTPLLGRFGTSGKYRAAIKEMQDVLTRLRTGAALNEQEIAFYESQTPLLTDNQETIDYKLNLFKNLYTDVINRGSSQSSIPTNTTPYGTNADWEVIAP